MTSDPVAAGARAAAEELAAELGAGVVVEVEEALDTRTPAPRPEHYFDPVALGSLIVSAAGLAWQVYRDLRQKAAPATPGAVARTVRIELGEGADVDAERLDRVVEVVVRETLRAAEGTG